MVLIVVGISEKSALANVEFSGLFDLIKAFV